MSCCILCVCVRVCVGDGRLLSMYTCMYVCVCVYIRSQVPALCEDLLSSVDQPLKISRDKTTGKDYLLCDYNRDGDSYRYTYSLCVLSLFMALLCFSLTSISLSLSLSLSLSNSHTSIIM